MYDNEYYVNGKRFVFKFTHKPYYTDENTIVMGFPYNMNISDFNENHTDTVKGYYTYIKFEPDSIKIIIDIFANYRTYYMVYDGTTYFSNDFLTLFNILPKEEREPNEFELEYWDKHRYTTGGESLCKKIHKLKAAHIYKFTENGIEEKLYFKDIKNVPNRKVHFEEVLTDLRETVSIIKKLPQKKFLLFSGGADSTLLVKLLQEQGVEFTPVFARCVPSYKLNYDDTLKIKYSSKLLNIEPVEIIADINVPMDKNIIDTMFTDRHITQMFVKMAEEIKNNLGGGGDCILLNGQVADSAFGYGPTDKNITSLLAREMLFQPFSPLSKIALGIIKCFKWSKCRIYDNVRNLDEYLCAFFDEKYYMPLKDTSKSEEYKNNIKKIVDEVKNNLNNFNAQRMYLKIFGFIQGSDNFVHIQALEPLGLKPVFMFASPKLIYSNVQNTDYNYEILHPKSVVYKILKDVFNYTMPNIKQERNYRQDYSHQQNVGDYENFIYKNFYDRVNELEFSKKIHVGK